MAIDTLRVHPQGHVGHLARVDFIWRIHILEVVRSDFLEDNVVRCIFGYASSGLRIVVVDRKVHT